MNEIPFDREEPCCGNCEFILHHKSIRTKDRKIIDELLCDNPENHDYFPKGNFYKNSPLRTLKLCVKLTDCCKHHKFREEKTNQQSRRIE